MLSFLPIFAPCLTDSGASVHSSNVTKQIDNGRKIESDFSLFLVGGKERADIGRCSFTYRAKQITLVPSDVYPPDTLLQAKRQTNLL